MRHIGAFLVSNTCQIERGNINVMLHINIHVRIIYILYHYLETQYHCLAYKKQNTNVDLVKAFYEIFFSPEKRNIFLAMSDEIFIFYVDAWLTDP